MGVVNKMNSVFQWNKFQAIIYYLYIEDKPTLIYKYTATPTIDTPSTGLLGRPKPVRPARGRWREGDPKRAPVCHGRSTATAN